MAAPSTTFASSLTDGVPFLYPRIGNRDARSKWAVLCLVPKVGSTIWKAALIRGLVLHHFDINGTEHVPSLDAVLFEGVHERPLPYALPSEAEWNHKSTPRLMLVRHPLSRLLSAYLGKVTTSYFAEYNSSLSFRAFATKVMTAQPRTLDRHFQPQVRQCNIQSQAARGSPYTYFRVEEMGRWYRRFVCMLGLQNAVASSFVHRGEARLALRQMAHPAATSGRRLRETMTINLRSHGQQFTGSGCLVRTLDCGCELRCGGSKCNGTLASTAESLYHSFNLATEQLEEYYDKDLARRVNSWAAADLREFGYDPWMPRGGGKSAAGSRADEVKAHVQGKA